MGKNSSLVYKLVLDAAKAMKTLDNFRNKVVKTNKDIESANNMMTRKTMSFGGARIGFQEKMFGKQVGAKLTGPFPADEAAKKMSFLSRISGKLSTTLGMTSIKAMTLGGSFNTLVTGLMKLNPVVVGLTLAFGKLMERTFHYGNIIEQSRMVLTSIWNSEKRAVKAIQGMREFSRITQHSPEEVVGATTMLAKYNVDPFEKGAYGLAGNKNVMNLMSGLAAMPGMGGQPIGLDRAVNAAIAGRDVRPLKALGPEVLAAYEKAREAGMSGTPEYIKVMLEELAKVPKIMELANAQANQLSTMWNTIKGYAEEFFMDFSGAGEETGIVTLWSQLKDILMVIRDEGEKFVVYVGPYLTELGAALGTTFKTLFDTLRLIWKIVGPKLVPAFKIFVQLSRIAMEIWKALWNTFIQLGKILVEIVTLPFRLLNAIFGINVRIENIIGNLQKLVLGLQITFMFLRIYLDGILEDVENSTNRMVSAAQRFGKELKLAFQEAFSGLSDWLKEKLGEKLYNFLFVTEFIPDIYDDVFGKRGNIDDRNYVKETIKKENPGLSEEELNKRTDEILMRQHGPGSSGTQKKTGEPIVIRVQEFFDKFDVFKQADNWVRMRQAERLDNMRMNNYNTTINNYETPNYFFEQMKNFSGSTQSQLKKMGLRIP